jgi:hypothetical protein
MPQRFIQVLPPILVSQFDGAPLLRREGEELQPVVIPFAAFVISRLHDPVFGQSMAALEACEYIRSAVSQLTPDITHLALAEGAWRLLAQAVQSPNARLQYDPAVAINLLPFMRAVLSASDTTPKSEVEPTAPDPAPLAATAN